MKNQKADPEKDSVTRAPESGDPSPAGKNDKADKSAGEPKKIKVNDPKVTEAPES